MLPTTTNKALVKCAPRTINNGILIAQSAGIEIHQDLLSSQDLFIIMRAISKGAIKAVEFRVKDNDETFSES